MLCRANFLVCFLRKKGVRGNVGVERARVWEMNGLVYVVELQRVAFVTVARGCKKWAEIGGIREKVLYL